MTYDIQLLLIGGLALAAGIFGGLYLIKPPRPLSMADYQRKAEQSLAKAQEQCAQIKTEAAARMENLRARYRQDEERMKEQFKRLENLRSPPRKSSTRPRSRKTRIPRPSLNTRPAWLTRKKKKSPS